MNPLSNVSADVANARAQGAAAQTSLNNQSGQLQGQYGQAQNQANSAYQTAQNAQAGIQDAGQNYGNYLQGAESGVGFDPQALTQANQNMVTAQNQIANAPLAAQQAGNYYGTTSGGTTNIYGQLMNNLNPALTNATNSAGALSNEYGLLTNQANQQAGLTLQAQTSKAGAATANYQSAVQQMQTAGQTMAQIESLAQSQGTATAQQISAYQNAYSQYVQASAAASLASAQAQQQQMQNQMTQGYMNSQAYQNYLKYGNTSGPPPAATPAGTSAVPSNSAPSTPSTASPGILQHASNGLHDIFGYLGQQFNPMSPQ
jgi:hypothetical protein